MASRKEQKERLRAERIAREAEDQAKERRRRLVQYGSAAAFLAVCAVAVLVVVSQSGGGSSGSGAEGASEVEKELQGIPQQGTVLGDPKAEVTVTEFGDLQCPACKEFSDQTVSGLVSGPVGDGDVKLDFRQFVIIGPESSDAAKAALAAAEQDRYWNFIELFYRNQGFENSGYVTDDFLESVAEGAGVPDIPKWNEDREDPKLDDELSKVQTEAQTLGFSSTPSFLVEGPGGKKNTFSGVLTLPELEQAIESVQ
jgi:protein-disulfide isomerase